MKKVWNRLRFECKYAKWQPPSLYTKKGIFSQGFTNGFPGR